jgi:hypothetical protein
LGDEGLAVSDHLLPAPRGYIVGAARPQGIEDAAIGDGIACSSIACNAYRHGRRTEVLKVLRVASGYLFCVLRLSSPKNMPHMVTLKTLRTRF